MKKKLFSYLLYNISIFIAFSQQNNDSIYKFTNLAVPNNRLEFSWAVTDIPQKIMSNNKGLTYHQSKGLPSSWTPTLKNLIIAPFIFKYDEPSSVYHLRYWLNVEQKTAYAIGISAAHLKPDALESGIYLGNGYNQIGLSFSIKRNILPTINRTSFRFLNRYKLLLTSTISIGPMLTAPIQHDISKRYLPYASIVPQFMQKGGANPYQITGVGATLYETIDLKINKGLYVYTGFLMQHTLSRKLRSLDKISGEISEERFSSLTFAATYIGLKFFFGWRKGTLAYIGNKMRS